MAADPRMTSRDDPGVPSLFRLVTGGTFTGGKSFWLASANETPRTSDEPREGDHGTTAEKAAAPSSLADRPS
jgi:hypothetical protein